METILQSLPVYMMIGIVVVAVIAQLNRIAGGLLGVLFWIVVAIIGTEAYEQGGSIGIVNFKFSQTFFYVFCIGLALVHAWMALASFRAKRRATSVPNDE